MTQTDINFNQFMQANHLSANLISYRYSLPDTIDPYSLVTLLSPERRRLTREVVRYQLYNRYGEYCGENLKLGQLNQLLTDFIDNDQVQLIAHPTVPNLDVVVDLVHEVNRMGLHVGGTHQEVTEAWEIVNDQRFMAALKRAQHTDEEQLICHEGINKCKRFIDRDHQVVMNELEKDYASTAHLEGEFYEVRDEAGRVLLNEVPLERLAVVLLALLLGESPESITSLFLRPNPSREDLSDTKLLYGVTQTSAFCELHRVSDIDVIENSSVDETLPVVAKYSLTNTYGETIPSNHVLSTLEAIFHDEMAGTNREQQGISNWLLKLASQQDLVIKRYDRQASFTADITDLIVEGDQIVDVDIRPRSQKSRPQIETCFEVLERESMRTVKFDLSFDTLVTYLLAYATKHGHDWSFSNNDIQVGGL